MFKDLNKELFLIKENLRKKAKYEEHIDRLNTYFYEEKGKKYKLEDMLLQEEENVAKLEGFSLSNVFYTLTGKKHEKLDMKQQEVMAAKLKYIEAAETIADVELELQEFLGLLAQIGNPEKRYQEILREKERLIHDSDTEWSENLFELVEQETGLESNLIEYQEAIAVGGTAEASLKQALSSLDSAKNWSTWDMIGGGMISTHMKHSRLNEAKSSIHDAQRKLRLFQEELKDIQHHFNSNLEIGGMLTFVDYFFDGIIVDWMVHGKITNSYDQTRETYRRVSSLVNSLRDQQRELLRKLENVQIEKKNLLETSG
ncbi:hypothetical protein [Sutcliffiella rhizosphaerae]|uniref:Uncharacterized protein n=1 Tax=Sutcliffiella rhizosphaerae TaxID=2880967 RepID=A0ABM8YNF1_9BACI|nr:hypothetical protein [Sutcliffiella rhizosphaerae]CAG9621513.1 hypothetical protein BACCIP111883_02286 [Sutcliffiella rhizosphaerae]